MGYGLAVVSSSCCAPVHLHAHIFAGFALCSSTQELSLESGALARLDISNCPHLQRLHMPALAAQRQQMQLEAVAAPDQPQHQQPYPQNPQQQLNLLPPGVTTAAAALQPQVHFGALAAAVGRSGTAAGTGGGGGRAGGAGAPVVGALVAAAAGSGVLVRMAGCDRLPAETAVLLRRLRERAKQSAAAAAAAAAAVNPAAAG